MHLISVEWQFLSEINKQLEILINLINYKKAKDESVSGLLYE